MAEKLSQIIKGDTAYIKVKKSGDSNSSILYECRKVEIKKSKEKKDVTQFPYDYTTYIVMGKKEITITFESYTVNEYIKEAIESLDSDILFDIEIYKDDTHKEVFTNMIMVSDTNVLDVNDVEQYTLEFTKGK
ncbi:hypothetical protein B5E87_00170 [Massilimicrobiota sp. An142]|uniref:hypothetical protein n=1 Tax=Massilimicrobiota sp. An142 TaxID=1965564 RepID=UPI000B3679CD|nr:hypothetical protein [Massilimicrobiota sp. An142]OUQ15021.1 hypothetical protein B5E87_00170 [Massilimicrobiota sp. An142]